VGLTSSSLHDIERHLFVSFRVPDNTRTVWHVLEEIRTNPGELLIRQWNWKSAVFSTLIRGLIFLFANLSAGWHAAAGAMVAEFIFRALTSGFYGSLTQAFRKVKPVWAAGIAVLILLPVVSHSMELAVHLARGTPKIAHSMIASIAFTELSTLFNLYAMRRGALVVGAEASSIAADLKRIPMLIVGFVASGPLAIIRCARRLQQF
jgi:hypothetical protein